MLRVGRLFFCLTFFLSAITLHAEQLWTEVKSPHFRVLTNGNPSDARQIALGFEQMRYVFATQFPGFRLDSGAPLTIFAARDENTAKMLEPGIWKMKGQAKPGGLYKHGWDKQYAMVRLDSVGANPYATIYHEYTHSVFALNSRWLPTWLNEGLAEFYGHTRFQQNKIEIGVPPGERAREFSKVPIPVRKLISESNPMAHGGDNSEAGIYYAECWALIHYMNFAPGMESGEKLNQFFNLLQDGTDQNKAFQQVFGSPDALDKPLDQYMRNLAFHAAVLPNPPQMNDKNYVIRKLTMAETNADWLAIICGVAMQPVPLL